MNAARLAYAANWQLARRWLHTTGGRSRRPELAEVGQPQYVSVVTRLPADLAELLTEAAAPLRGAQPEHYIYPAESIHLTILALADSAGADDEIRSVAERHQPFAVDARGLNLSRRTVFVELYPRGPELGAIRRELRCALPPLHPPPSRWLRHGLAHANVVRFAAPVDRRLVAEVAKLRTRYFGRFEVAEIELVRTDILLSAGGTRALGRFPLGRSDRSPHSG